MPKCSFVQPSESFVEKVGSDFYSLKVSFVLEEQNNLFLTFSIIWTWYHWTNSDHLKEDMKYKIYNIPWFIFHFSLKDQENFKK